MPPLRKLFSGLGKSIELESFMGSLSQFLIDRFPSLYTPIMKIYLRKLPRFRKYVVDLAMLKGDEIVLEIGSGQGDLSALIAKKVPHGKTYGIDISEKLVKRARKKWRLPNLEFKIADATDLPFPDSSFDVVFSVLTFHLLSRDQQEMVLREIFRVLKPSGRFVNAEFSGKLDWLTSTFGVKEELTGSELRRAGFRVVFEESFPERSIVARVLEPLKEGFDEP